MTGRQPANPLEPNPRLPDILAIAGRRDQKQTVHRASLFPWRLNVFGDRDVEGTMRPRNERAARSPARPIAPTKRSSRVCGVAGSVRHAATRTSLL